MDQAKWQKAFWAEKLKQADRIEYPHLIEKLKKPLDVTSPVGVLRSCA